MRSDLYLAECVRIADDNVALLNSVKLRINNNHAPLSPLEQNGVLHAIQIMIENAIGKAKHILKARAQTVPVSAYDAFASLAREGVITSQELSKWHALIGLRNRIVHDYMNLDIRYIDTLILSDGHVFVGLFLCSPLL